MKFKRHKVYRPNQVPGSWVDNILVLWTEDECLLRDPTAEHLSDAYSRIVGKEYDQADVLANHDGGDTLYSLLVGGWVVVSSYDGDSVGVLVQTRDGGAP